MGNWVRNSIVSIIIRAFVLAPTSVAHAGLLDLGNTLGGVTDTVTGTVDSVTGTVTDTVCSATQQLLNGVC